MGKDNKQNAEKPKISGSNKTKYYLMILLAGVGLTVWSVVFKHKNVMDLARNFKHKLEMEDDDKTGDEIMEEGDMELGDDSGVVSNPTGNYLEGRLENSDDQSKGNLKLSSSAHEIYLRTSRDFSALIGANVLMYIDGTLEKFTLVNIEKKVEKDGYIQAN